MRNKTIFNPNLLKNYGQWQGFRKGYAKEGACYKDSEIFKNKKIEFLENKIQELENISLSKRDKEMLNLYKIRLKNERNN